MKKNISWTNVLLAFFTAVLFMVLVWRDWNPRMLILFVAFSIFAEFFLHLRWRMSLPCPHCDFDPLLYKTNREMAMQKVKVKLDDLRFTGKYFLSKSNPFMHIPVIRVKSDTGKKTMTPSRYISKEI